MIANTKVRPHKHQQAAIDVLVPTLSTEKRATCVMPCGTGKTLVGLEVRRQLDPRRTVIVAPSLALIRQLLDTYVLQGAIDRPVQVVCSDDSTAEEARNTFNIPEVTTNAQTIANVLKATDGVLIFATYQSVPRIAQAYATRKLPPIDLAIFDEGHRMAGGFTTGLHDDLVPIKNRLFMTATPRITGDDDTVASMDNPRLFGPIAYEMTFGEAIRLGLLADFNVIVATVTETETRQFIEDNEHAQELGKQIALARVMKEHKVSRVLAFHARVAMMRRFTRHTFPEVYKRITRKGNLWCQMLSGDHVAAKRIDRLGQFAGLPPDVSAVLSNCKVLQEGIDVPLIDAIAFMSLKTSPIEVAQAVGRAIRRHGDKVATVILPVFVPAAEEHDVEKYITGKCSQMWAVINAIHAHDERVRGVARPALIAEPHEPTIWFSGNVFSDDVFDRLKKKIETKMLRWELEGIRLDREEIKGWIRDYHAEHGKYPFHTTKTKTPCGLSWRVVGESLRLGLRGLEPGDTLLKLCRELGDTRRDRFPSTSVLDVDQIKTWMEEYHQQHGKYPAGEMQELSPCGSTWKAIDTALRQGARGLPGGSSLYQLRVPAGKRIAAGSSSVLDAEQIKTWMEEYRQQHGKYPSGESQELSPCGSTWKALNGALKNGSRGLPGGSSLYQLRGGPGDFDVEQIKAWLEEYRDQHGRYPASKSPERSPCGLTWRTLNKTLREGSRGLPKGSSLAKLKKEIAAQATA